MSIQLLLQAVAQETTNHVQYLSDESFSLNGVPLKLNHGVIDGNGIRMRMHDAKDFLNELRKESFIHASNQQIHSILLTYHELQRYGTH
jgi:hypothetical protein